MKKIIVKAEVKDVDKLENRLMNLGYDFDPRYWQHSRIFVPRNYEEHNNFARMILRMDVKAVDRPARYSLICKRHLEKSKIDLVHETLVSSYAEAANILLQMGLIIQSEVSRTRQEVVLENGITIYLDQIEHGRKSYIKFEAVLENESEAEEIRNRIEVLMMDLNILPDLVVKDTYGETAK